MTAPHSISSDSAHYFGAIRVRLKQLYDREAGNPRLREHISDEIDWIDMQIKTLRTPALPSGGANDEPWQNLDSILNALDRAGCCTGTGYIHAAEDVVANAIRNWLRASSPIPQIAGDVRDALQKVEAEARRYADMYQPSSDGRNTFVIFADWVAALSPQPQPVVPPFSRWADTIEAASLTISPEGSKALNALAAEVRAGGAAQRELGRDIDAISGCADDQKIFAQHADHIGDVNDMIAAEANSLVTEWLGLFDPPPQIDFQQSEFLQQGIASALRNAQGVPEPEAYRETVRQIAAVREKRMAEMREALERIRNFPHDKTACEQAMSQIAGEALAMSSTPQKTLGRTDREGGWNAERGLSVTSTEGK